LSENLCKIQLTINTLLIVNWILSMLGHESG